ncbi:MAG TPA: triose-phosphate isomerase [Longimicrobiales bacterium]|nr:triose-phosphate isomerase [Longimicrobiales bacterium]
MSWPKPVIAGNWKMNKGPQAARDFAAEFATRHAPASRQTVILFPPAISLATVTNALRGRRDIHVGVQNIHYEKEGAFTGETSATMARDAGATFALIGHSERRHIFAETDDDVRRKVAAALRAKLTPVICVGETLDQRKAGQLEQVITTQLSDAIRDLTGDQVNAFLVAYEPVWAIGTGVTATPADASEAHAILKRVLQDQLGAESDVVPILYGGSVKPENAAELLMAEGVDGLLIGGASLDPEGFATIARLAGAT